MQKRGKYRSVCQLLLADKGQNIFSFLMYLFLASSSLFPHLFTEKVIWMSECAGYPLDPLNMSQNLSPEMRTSPVAQPSPCAGEDHYCSYKQVTPAKKPSKSKTVQFESTAQHPCSNVNRAGPHEPHLRPTLIEQRLPPCRTSQPPTGAATKLPAAAPTTCTMTVMKSTLSLWSARRTITCIQHIRT